MRQLVLTLALFIPPLVAQDKLQTFEAVISDSHGNSIEGLNIDDFQLQDDGKHYRISVFRSNAVKTDSATLLAHQFSNRPRQPDRAAMLILLDLLNLDVRQLIYVRDRLVSALALTDTQDYVLLYLLTSHGLVTAQGFPLTAAQAPDNRWMARIGSLLEGATGGVINDADRPNATARFMEATTDLLDGFPGRRSVLWITDGFSPALEGSVRSEIASSPFVKRVGSAFSPKGITLYAASGFAGLLQAGAAAGRLASPGRESLTLVAAAAEATGGRAYLDRDIVGAIKDAVTAKNKPTYTIGFYPEQWDGKTHRLELKCTRRGVVVSAPEQYVANPDQAMPAARQKAAVDRLAAAAFDAQDIGLQVSIAPSPKLAGGIQMQVRIDASDLRLWRQNDDYAGQLSTTIVYYDATGRREVLKSADHEFHLTAQQRDAATQSGIGLAEDRQAPSSAVKMRIIVFDPHSNAAGSITVPITGSDRRNSVSP